MRKTDRKQGCKINVCTLTSLWDPVGMSLGISYTGASRDVAILGPCDDGFLQLARELGWEEELRALMQPNK